jgi:phytoene synthase
MTTLAHSYAYCEQLARQKAGNFYHGFRLLPRPQRRATCALYAFLRIADDLTDDASDGDRRLSLERWRRQLENALEGKYAHPLHAALHDAVRTYRIPREYLDDALIGVGMDLDVRRYDSFADLYTYCYRVAAVVGLSCIHIWGYRADAAKRHAESAGIAFQLTNILRDLAEDADRNRIYLPGEDLRQFGYSEEQLCRRERNRQYLEMMAFQARRAYGYYAEGERLLDLLPPPGRAVFQVMMRTYRGLLDVIVRRDYDVFSRRARLANWRKAWLTLQAVPVRWGWI